MSRLTLAGLMGIVAIAALGFAALTIATDSWCRVIYTLTAGSFLTAILCARARPEPESVSWFGFSLFGWAYLLISLAPWTDIRPNVYLLTTPMVGELAAHLHPVDPTMRASGVVSSIDVANHNRTILNATLIAHLLLSWVFALSGAALARCLQIGPMPQRR